MAAACWRALSGGDPDGLHWQFPRRGLLHPRRLRRHHDAHLVAQPPAARRALKRLHRFGQRDPAPAAARQQIRRSGTRARPKTPLALHAQLGRSAYARLAGDDVQARMSWMTKLE
eukprot:3578112-Pleurochrysis_carterae.AAC.1